jgi:hypothetical protein
MRTHLTTFAAAVLLFALAAWAAPRLTDTALNHVELTGCDGGISASVPAGDYLVAVKNDAVTVCVNDAGCAAGGQYLPQGFAMRLTFGNSNLFTTTPDIISCKSPTGDGGLSLTLVAPGS